MNNSTVLTRNPDVMVRELPESEGAVLLNLATGAYHGLNPAGFVTWDLIDGVRTVEELVDGVFAKFADAPAAVKTDVLRFLDGALERDLVREAL
jgi:hypothetical protein